MKKLKSKKGIFAVIAALFLALALWAGLTPPVSVSHAAMLGDYKITQYNVTMDVSEKLVVSVTEEITVQFRERTGWENDLHGIIRDLPLGGGVRYRNLSAQCDRSDFSPKVHNDDTDYLSYYLRGSRTVYGETRTYTLSYEMLLPALHGNVLSLDIIGYGWTAAAIQNVTARITVPQGVSLKAVFSGGYGTVDDKYTDGGVQSGNAITITASELPRAFYDKEGNCLAGGITLDMSFEKGVFSSSPDLSILWVLLIGIALIVLAAIVKIFFCRQPALVKTVNFEPPQGMDPLRMGKLIDNSVDSEDIGALVFWLAAEGYLTIDVSQSQDDPLLIRTQKEINRLPAHAKLFYEGLFSSRESVRVSQLENSFYKTVDGMKALFSADRVKIFEMKSNLFTGLFGVLALVLLGGFTFLYSMFTVIRSYYFWVDFAFIAVGFFAGFFGVNLAMQRYHKWKKGKKILSVSVGIAVGVIASLVSMLFPCAAFTRLTNLIVSLCALAVGCVAGTFLCRTKQYNEQLGQILGFKQFIEFTERDKIEFMLKENPELYYKILPYAQVLGVTDLWTEKFKGLDMQAPSYMRSSGAEFVFDYLLWRSMFRSMNISLVRHMISRPSSSGGGGKFGGGGFRGGFGGGGFGGGGGRRC